MQATNDLLRSLTEAGVRISAQSGQVSFQIPEGLPPQEKAKLHRVVELLEQAQFSADFPIRPRAAGCLVPLTPVQRRFWNSKQEPRLSVRFCAVALRVHGPLSIPLLRRSIDAVVRRHESLRTRFVAIDGIPQQHVDEGCEDYLEEVDLSQVSSMNLEDEVRRLLKAFLDEKVDISVGPLFKAKLIGLSANEHVLILALDHLISDGVSEEILDREIWELYKQGAHGEALRLPELPVQFGDYSVWQEQTSGAWLQKHQGYWKDRLAGAPRIQIPPDEGLVETQNPIVTIVDIPFGKTLSHQLREVARRERTLLALVIFALYLVVMRRWCDRSDLLTIFVSNGRILPELEGMIGFLATCPYLRVTLDDQASLRDLVAQVNREFNSAYEHMDFHRVPDFVPDCATDLGFNWLPTSWNSSRWSTHEPRMIDDHLRIEPYSFDVNLPAKFAPWFFDTAEGIKVTVVYRKDYFFPKTIERFGRELQMLAETFAERPLTSVASALALLHAH